MGSPAGTKRPQSVEQMPWTARWRLRNAWSTSRQEALPILAEVHSCSDNVASQHRPYQSSHVGETRNRCMLHFLGSYVSVDLIMYYRPPVTRDSSVTHTIHLISWIVVVRVRNHLMSEISRGMLRA